MLLAQNQFDVVTVFFVNLENMLKCKYLWKLSEGTFVEDIERGMLMLVIAIICCTEICERGTMIFVYLLYSIEWEGKPSVIEDIKCEMRDVVCLLLANGKLNNTYPTWYLLRNKYIWFLFSNCGHLK